MRSRWWLLASLMLVIDPRWAAAEDAKRIESDKAAKIAATLVAATSELSGLPVKVTADPQRAMGVTGHDRGGVLVPDTRLTAEALKKVDKDVLPIGLLFLHRITLSVAEQATPADQHRQRAFARRPGGVPARRQGNARTRHLFVRSGGGELSGNQCPVQ